MNRVSSQLTIVLRIVIPTVWFTSIVATLVMLTWAVRGRAGLFSNPYIWLSILFVVGTGFAFIRFVLWRLYRIDMDSEHLYVSNYFKTYKYPYSEVLAIRDAGIMKERIYRITLKSKGSFGQNLYFVASKVLWLDFKNEHPELSDLWVNGDLE
jgi:hypothetical protein